MKRLLTILVVLAGLASGPAWAALRIFACEPEWAALAQELGGDRIEAYSATTAMQDPHRIEARPSLIARLRRADLVLCTGADLEAGWLPVLLRQAGNAAVQPGKPGYFEAAAAVTLLEIPTRIDRAMGDIHAAGNPHLHLDPRRLATVAERLAERLAALDPGEAGHYRQRHAQFAQRWAQAIEKWETQAARLRGMRVVSHHKSWTYLYDWLGLVEVGLLEPKPGIPPSAAHLGQLKAKLARSPARLVVRTPFDDPQPAAWLAQQMGIPAVVLPYTVGGTPEAQDLFGLFDDTIRWLLGGGGRAP